MVDTLSITYKVSNTNVDSLIHKGWDYRLNISGGQGSEVFFNDIRDKRYFFYCPGNILRVEFSVPNILYGKNYLLVKSSDIPAIKEILRSDDVINYFSPVSYNCNVSRVDYVVNFKVDDTSKYIQSFSNVNIPRMTKSIYNDSQTVFYKNSRRAIRVYDKYSECKQEETRGILRLETQLRSKYLNDVLSDRSFDNVVNFQTAVYFLSDAFNTLRAGYMCISEDTVLNILFSKYKPTYASALYGFYKLIVEYGIDNVKRLYSKATFYRYLHVFNSLNIRLYNEVLDTLDFREAVRSIA